MLHAFTDLRGFGLRSDSEAEPQGTVEDLYFDDESWRLR